MVSKGGRRIYNALKEQSEFVELLLMINRGSYKAAADSIGYTSAQVRRLRQRTHGPTAELTKKLIRVVDRSIVEADADAVEPADKFHVAVCKHARRMLADKWDQALTTSKNFSISAGLCEEIPMLLADGEMELHDLFAAVCEGRIGRHAPSLSNLRAAGRKLGVIKRVEGVGKGMKSYWSMPDQPSKNGVDKDSEPDDSLSKSDEEAIAEARATLDKVKRRVRGRQSSVHVKTAGD